MKIIIFLVFYLAPIWTWPSEQRMVPLGNINKRIISGQEAAKGQFPWQAAIFIQTSNGTAFCGGSIISNQWILTAGHCAKGNWTWTISLGTNTRTPDDDAVMVKTTRAIVHPQYDKDNKKNDIALLRLNSPISYSANIQPIPLDSHAIGAGVNVEVSGFGKTSDGASEASNYLNYVDLYTISNDECSKYFRHITDQILCCRGWDRQSTCIGDSGGALVLGTGSNAVQIGVDNFGNNASCESGSPSAFARVSYHRQWIRSKSGV